MSCVNIFFSRITKRIYVAEGEAVIILFNIMNPQPKGHNFGNKRCKIDVFLSIYS